MTKGLLICAYYRTWRLNKLLKQSESNVTNWPSKALFGTKKLIIKWRIKRTEIHTKDEEPLIVYTSTLAVKLIA